jgi:hypothetical protein
VIVGAGALVVGAGALVVDVSALVSEPEDYFNCEVSTLEGVSFPSTIVFELMAIALIIAAIFFRSRLPISSSGV